MCASIHISLEWTNLFGADWYCDIEVSHGAHQYVHVPWTLLFLFSPAHACTHHFQLSTLSKLILAYSQSFKQAHQILDRMVETVQQFFFIPFYREIIVIFFLVFRSLSSLSFIWSHCLFQQANVFRVTGEKNVSTGTKISCNCWNKNKVFCIRLQLDCLDVHSHKHRSILLKIILNNSLNIIWKEIRDG